MGRNSQNKVVVFPKDSVPGSGKGEYVDVEVTDCTQATLLGKGRPEGHQQGK
jgi:tRNA-2-methylthio-N6-dimethylallyladenosine synthase